MREEQAPITMTASLTLFFSLFIILHIRENRKLELR